ncbi:NAD(P)-dependent oxidoreductase, partial [Virgibacillus halodenitrificans]|nr:NAD(P)-dependent oxidoreductase [Virgibacillus halodenitrificans]
MSLTEKKIGFIGTGVMGKSMALNLQRAGYFINIYTRTKEKANHLIDHGAVWKESIKDLAVASDIIITMVGYPSDVEEVYFGESGILENAKAGSCLIDMTTSKPSLAINIFQQAKAKSIHALDAPVSGGDIGAQKGTLAIMVGGEEDAYEALLPLF